MNTRRTCGKCGAVLDQKVAKGLCPRCLMLGGLTAEDTGAPALDASASKNHTDDRFQAPWSSRLDSGPTKFGDYELLEEIARGGMGVVYRARQVSLNRTVAIKMLRAGPFASKEFVHRFRTEAAAAAVLQHPNIVAVHEVGVHGGEHFFSMDFVAGRDLQQIVRDGPLPTKPAAQYVRKIAEAIDYAHQQGILHRDLKPSNVLIDANDQPRITDFGLAKQLGADSGVTVSGQVLGTPGFLPPEQVSGTRGAARSWSDVYSLGAILYCLLTGRAPFMAGSVEETLHQVLHQEPVSPRLLNVAVPRDLETICLKCLEKEPTRRYPTALELADELRRFLQDEPIAARPVSTTGKAWRWCRRKPVVAALAAGLMLSVIIGAVATAWQLRRVEHAAKDLRQRVYASDMNLAFRALSEKNPGRALDLLKRHLPRRGENDLRAFEWRYLWQHCRGDEVSSIAAHEAEVSALALSPDGRLLATGGYDHTVKLWDAATRQLQRTLPVSGRIAWWGLTFSPDGKLVAAADGNSLRVFEAGTGRLLRELSQVSGPLLFLPSKPHTCWQGPQWLAGLEHRNLGNAAAGNSTELFCRLLFGRALDRGRGKSRHELPDSPV